MIKIIKNQTSITKESPIINIQLNPRIALGLVIEKLVIGHCLVIARLAEQREAGILVIGCLNKHYFGFNYS